MAIAVKAPGVVFDNKGSWDEAESPCTFHSQMEVLPFSKDNSGGCQKDSILCRQVKLNVKTAGSHRYTLTIMGKNLYFLVNPSDEEKRVIEKLLDYLVRTQFKELYLPDVRNDDELSKEEKGTLDIWFHPDYDLIRLGNITFRRYGVRWNYEIHSIESTLLICVRKVK